MKKHTNITQEITGAYYKEEVNWDKWLDRGLIAVVVALPVYLVIRSLMG